MPPSGPPPASARPTRGRLRPRLRTRVSRPVAVRSGMDLLEGFMGGGAILQDHPRFVVPFRARFARFTACARAGFLATFAACRVVAALAVFGAPAAANAGSETGSACCTCCAMLAATLAACFTVDATVLRVPFQTEFA